MVQAEKMWLDWTPDMFAGSTAITVFFSKVALYFINSMLHGFAEKAEETEKKKAL